MSEPPVVLSVALTVLSEVTESSTAPLAARPSSPRSSSAIVSATPVSVAREVSPAPPPRTPIEVRLTPLVIALTAETVIVRSPLAAVLAAIDPLVIASTVAVTSMTVMSTSPPLP